MTIFNQDQVYLIYYGVYYSKEEYQTSSTSVLYSQLSIVPLLSPLHSPRGTQI